MQKNTIISSECSDIDLVVLLELCLSIQRNPVFGVCIKNMRCFKTLQFFRITKHCQLVIKKLWNHLRKRERNLTTVVALQFFQYAVPRLLNHLCHEKWNWGLDARAWGILFVLKKENRWMRDPRVYLYGKFNDIYL